MAPAECGPIADGVRSCRSSPGVQVWCVRTRGAQAGDGLSLRHLLPGAALRTHGESPKAPPLLVCSRSRKMPFDGAANLGTPSAISLTTAISGASVQAGWGTPLLQLASVPPGAVADAAGSGVLVQAGRESPLFMPAGAPWRAAHPLGVLVQAGRVNPSFMSANPFRRVRFPLRGPGPGRPGKPRFYSGRARMVSRQRPSTSVLSQAPCRRRVDSSVSRTPVPCGSSFQRTGASPIRS